MKEAENRELLEKIRRQEQMLAERQGQVEHYETQKNAYYEETLKTRENAILSELRQAKEEGDVDKEIHLSKALAQVAAEQSTYELYKSQGRQEYERLEQGGYRDPHLHQSFVKRKGEIEDEGGRTSPPQGTEH